MSSRVITLSCSKTIIKGFKIGTKLNINNNLFLSFKFGRNLLSFINIYFKISSGDCKYNHYYE